LGVRKRFRNIYCLAGDLGFIEKGEFCTAKKDLAEIERMLKALIKSLENKHLNP
jgi:hypothetical protein